MTPQALFQFAKDYARACEAAGKGTQYPTYREVARKFRVRFDEIEEAMENWDQTESYMQAQVGISSGGGYGAFEKKGEYMVEAYDNV